MLFDESGNLGITDEGTLDHPIVVPGCSADTFANFLGWLNHKYVYRDNSLFIINTDIGL
jgi:hypothetical protein